LFDDSSVGVYLFEEDDCFSLAGAVDVGEEDIIEELLDEHGKVGRAEC